MDNSLKMALSVIVGSVVLIGGIVFLASMLDTPDQVTTEETVGVGGARNERGTNGAEITVVEFSDFECPACQAAHPGVKQFVEDHTDQVSFTYRHFPLPQHGNARPSAYAAEAAGEQGYFWQAHDWLFENQRRWTGAEVDAQYFYDGLSDEIDLDEEQFKADYESTDLRARINTDQSDGNRLGVNSTPTFFVNGERFSGALSYDRLVEIAGIQPMEQDSESVEVDDDEDSEASAGSDDSTPSPVVDQE